MAWGESSLDISILVVDDDDTSLTIAANILSSWEYKVLTANSAPSALKTLREFEGFFDLVITELHISGVNGFEFQRRVRDEFQLPVVMMSADKRKSVMSKSLENGAAHFVLKPICADDFKDIWQYARKEKPVTGAEELTIKDNQGAESPPSGDDEKVMSQDANSTAAVAASSVSSEPKQKRKYKKRIWSQMNNNHKEDHSEGPTKRSKIVWTTHLHNLFLMAIKQIGLDKAVPKKILEIMNVPNLTRENVASHLQKYRIFLRKVADRGLIEGISDRALRSRFASELPVSVIRDIKTRAGKLKLPLQRYLKGQGGPTIKDLHVSQASNNNSAYGNSTTQLGRGEQFPYLLQGGGKMLQNQQAINDLYSNALKQVRLGKSTFGSRLIGANNHVLGENMLGSNGASVFDQPKSSYNAGPVFPAYGMGHGLLTSSNALTGGFKFGGTMQNQNNGSLGNQSLLSYGLGNNKMASLGNSNLPLPLSSSSGCYPSSVSSGIQLNGGGTQLNGSGLNGGFNNSVGITRAIPTDNNSFGLLNGSYGTQNANMNVKPLALGQGNSGLVQGCYASPPAKDVYANASELAAATLVTNVTPQGNASGIQQLPQQLDGITWNAAGNEYQFDASSNTEGLASQVEDDLFKLFLTLDDMQLLNETRENIDANQFLNSDSPSSSHVMQFPKEPQKAGDVIVPSSTGNNINLPNHYESPTSTDKSPTQGNDGFLDWEPFDQLFVDNVSTASNSVPEQAWDMELFEAVFGNRAN